jgi:hypothetical protein
MGLRGLLREQLYLFTILENNSVLLGSVFVYHLMMALWAETCCE